MGLSATVLVRNNARTIERTIRSLLTLVDDLVIVDDSSSDQTLEIIKSIWPTARIFSRALSNDFASQRNFALMQCLHEWVIVIDSDEEIAPDLAVSIRQTVLSGGGEIEIFKSNRFNQSIAGWTETSSPRPLLMRRHLRFVDRVHERVVGADGFLKGHLYHYSWEGMSDFISDLNKYSSWRAKNWVDRSRDFSPTTLALRQFASFSFFFFKRMIFEKRVFQGPVGWMYCFAFATEEVFLGLKYFELVQYNKKLLKEDERRGV